MNFLISVFLLSAVFLGSCATASGPSGSSDSATATPSPKPSSAPVALDTHPDAPGVAPWEDPECFFEKTNLQLAPEPLVKEFLRRATNGDFLQRDKWLDRAVTCPGHLGGPDSFYVIRFYKILSKKIDKTKATFEVRFERVGTISSGGPNGDLLSFQSDHKKNTVTFEAIKTPFGWKLSEFDWQNVLARAVEDNPVAKGHSWAKGEQAKFKKAVESLRR